jgi:hypothetical protein
VARERVYEVRGPLEAQRQDLAALEELAEVVTDDGRRAEVAVRQASCTVFSADYAGASAAGERAVRLAHAVGDVRTEAAGYVQ